MARRLRITGVVQGVGYRAAMCDAARTLGLVGWVRNRRDGSVEALAAGDRQALDALCAWARRGPPLAAVAAVEVSEVDDAVLDAALAFEARPTA